METPHAGIRAPAPAPPSTDAGASSPVVRLTPSEPPRTGATRDALERRLRKARAILNADAGGAEEIPRQPGQASPTLTPAQESLWFLAQLEPESPAYNLCQGVSLRGMLDLRALERALNTIVQRHEPLRTNIIGREGRPVAVVHQHRELTIALTLVAEDESVDTLCQAEAARPFALADDLLIRARVLVRGPAHHLLLLTIHHIVADGWSMGVLFRELSTLYASFEAGRDAVSARNLLPEVPVRFSDWAASSAASPAGTRAEELRRFWRRELEGSVAALDLPYDHARRPDARAAAGWLSHRLDDAVAARLRALSRQEGATLFMTLLAAFQCVLHRWTGQADFVVGTAVAGRQKRGLENLIGYFVNLLAFRARFEGDPTFREFLGQVRERVFGAMSHQDLPFEHLVREVCPDRGMHRNPVFQVLFVLQNAAASPLHLGGIRSEPFDIPPAEAKFDLTLHVIEDATGMRAALEYDATLFAGDTAARLLRSLVTLLEGISADPGTPVGRLPLMSAAELRQIVTDWNATALPYDTTQTISGAFHQQVAKTPDAVALTWEPEPGDDLVRLTYRELDDAAERLAATLRARGIGAEDRVGIFLRRTPQLLVAILAVLKAGGAFVPLDPGYPAERLGFVIEDAGLVLLLTERHLEGSLPEARSPRLVIDAPGSVEKRPLPIPRPRREPDASSLAYVIYTSGSTGQPKGVAITQRSVMALVAWALCWYAPGDFNGILFATSACFDVSIFESLVPLCLGGRIVLVENLLSLGTLTAAAGVRFVSGVPSAMREVVRAGLLPPTVRTVNVAGEPCPQELVDALHATGSVRRVCDVYGPTETTVYSIGGDRRPGKRPTIGRPLPNERAYILDSYQEPVPIGVQGELYLGGDKLARGYLHRPDLTAERFVEVASLPGERLYRTGDLARWRPDGRIDYLGRVDRQVKVRGYRIEPGEIESALRQHPGVEEAAVLAVEDPANGSSLVAAVVSRLASIDAAALRDHLGRRLPAYMIPTRFVPLDALPLSPNGKLDARALARTLALERRAPPTDGEPRDPLEHTLVKIWEQALGRSAIGIQDDFFALGGHSLLAVRMSALLQERLGCHLPVSVLFRAPTIAALAQLLREEGVPAARASLVEIQAGRARSPVFWLHTLGGGGGAGLFTYHRLSQHLGPDQPAYGFVAVGEPASSFHAMAARYVADLKTVQPAGPYYLGGYCFGGVLAYEMARQLEAAGETVALVTLLDSFPPNAPRLPGRLSLTFFRHLACTGPAWVRQALGDPRDALVRTSRLMRRILRRRPAPGAGPVAAPPGAAHLADYIDLAHYPPDFKRHAEAHWAAMMQYQPQPIRAPILLFRTHRPRLLTYSAEDQWRQLARDVEVHVIGGTHQDLLADPQAAQVAAILQNRLGRP